MIWFTVDNYTYSLAQVRATFYPKFDNEKSDQEVRTRMIEMVSKGLATVEVSLKHSGSLFIYAGHKDGAYAKNSYGNIYTAVGVCVLGKMFCEARGTQVIIKQAEFNDFLEGNLDQSPPNAGYLLLIFYHLYEGKSCKEFETELIERFG